MQKVESSSLFIRSTKGPGNGAFFMPSDEDATSRYWGAAQVAKLVDRLYSRWLAYVSTHPGGPPVNGTVEVGGPETFRLDELIRRDLQELDDPREVIMDPEARDFDAEAELEERTFVPGDHASIAETRFGEWLSRSAAHQERTLRVKGG
jgi:uncharacterized protein YbjT (DUF2867 family)